MRRRRHGHGHGRRASELVPREAGRSSGLSPEVVAPGLAGGASRRSDVREREGVRQRRPARPRRAGRRGGRAGAPSCGGRASASGPARTRSSVVTASWSASARSVSSRGTARRGAPSQVGGDVGADLHQVRHEVAAGAPRRRCGGVAGRRPQPQPLHERAALTAQQPERVRRGRLAVERLGLHARQRSGGRPASADHGAHTPPAPARRGGSRAKHLRLRGAMCAGRSAW